MVKFLVVFLLLFSWEVKSEKNNSNFEYCDDEKITSKQRFNCNQDKMHENIIQNPLPFILFYVFSVLCIAFFFQLSQRNIKKIEKKKDEHNK